MPDKVESAGGFWVSKVGDEEIRRQEVGLRIGDPVLR